MRNLVLFFSIIVLVGCNKPDREERYNVGYDDGYAAGYNAECDVRVTQVEGDWESEDYYRGFKKGELSGIQDCRNGVEFIY